MTKFMSNINEYLSEMKIKQSYLSRITGIEQGKLARLLAGLQEESGSDMEKLAAGLGRSVEFFLSDTMAIPKIENIAVDEIVFCAGKPSQKQKQVAKQLMELMENIDEVLSAESRFKNLAKV